MSGPRSRRFLHGSLLLLLISGAILAAGFYNRVDPDDHFERGREALRAGQLDVVANEIAVLANYPNYAPHRHYLQALLFLHDREYTKSIDELKLTLFHPRFEVDARVAMGQALYNSGRVKEALASWNRAVAIDKDSADAHRWLGIYYYDIGATNQAVQHLETVARLDPLDPRPHRLLGVINRDFERYDAAVDCYRESLRRSSTQRDHNLILEELAACEIKRNNYEAAAAVLRASPQSAVRDTLLAECELSFGNLMEAERLVDQAISQSAEDVEALALKGRLSLQKGDAASAASAFERVLEVSPKNWAAHLSLAQAYQRLDRGEDAARFKARGEALRDRWRTYSELHVDALEQPTNAELRFEIGELALELGRPDLAVEWFRATLALNEDHEGAGQRMRTLTGDRPE